MSKEQLWHEMERHKTEAIGIICGSVSGNLEGIDADEKYMPGISARLFHDIQTLYPDLYPRLRIHGTPSKGFHILYRCAEGIEGNMKLAGRPATQTELAAKPKTKVVNFLETRGEGGYLAGPPSLGYTVVQDVPIPDLTAGERMALISLCRSYTYIQSAQAKPYKPTGKDDQYYDVNPFDDFNNRCNPAEVAVELGWTEYRHNNKFIWFTRPGGTARHVHLSFNLERRFYFCFTGNTELEEHHGYTPSNMVAAMLFGGDKKKTYLYLVNKGFGRVKESIERNKASAAARSGRQLPPNFSQEAQGLHSQVSSQLLQLHPHGTFWKYDDEGAIKISRELFYRVAAGLGFRYHAGDLVRIQGKFIYKIEEREFQDVLKAYIQEPDPLVFEEIADAYESFMQRNGKFTMARLEILPTQDILSDGPDLCYKYFQNGYLVIDVSGINFMPYDTLEALVWFDKIQHRDYATYQGGKYVDYLNKALVTPSSAAPVLGYLAHEYKDETMAYIIVLTEQCIDPKQGGGSGKNIFCNLLQHTTSYTSKPGVQAKFDEKFFQSWNGQRIFCISDVPNNFDFAFLKEPSSGSFIWKKLFKDEVEVKNEHAPKFIVQTNFSYEVSDGGLKRRIIPLEFTNFFTLAGGLDVHYGVHFPKGWSEQDWNGYDTYIAQAIQTWIQGRRKLSADDLTDTGWEKQFTHTYGATAADFITQNFEEWIKEGFVSNEVWSTRLNDHYRENDIKPNFHVSSKRLYEAISMYCKRNGCVFLNNQLKRAGLDNAVTKGKQFLPAAPF